MVLLLDLVPTKYSTRDGALFFYVIRKKLLFDKETPSVHNVGISLQFRLLQSFSS